MFETLSVERRGLSTTVTLNRPDVRNAFNETMIAEITQMFQKLDADATVRAIVLAANGPAFCAGADLNWMKKMADYTHAENLADAGQLAAMLAAIYRCSKPVVAKVQGDCYAGGMGLVAACDIAVSVDSANYCLSEVKLGLIPATISPYVIKAMGESAARRYFITAERFSAAEAQRIGFVHEVATAEALDDTVAGIVKALVSNSPNAVRQAKQLVQDVASRQLTPELITATVEGIAQIRASSEGREGVRSFLEKRKPAWLN
ncbi:enoyl-CoA hydratase/isomerase family protein [Undibacterium oligocarboniphilum]|uniref:Enoyl-CoA hydratase/isomerase family protein n=1 Tax=Undibacterium oligocarboniphilum TaxID=666702 RepID=A0A850QGK7_9BURK|nr:enoyl-CoA hydratase/isomerase family protein [Undibacterium oligocarboniphilum]MBC3870821.1 enoyl-CoA hydratase/isomerase family protein [Undibacterium oligocarboniphilum]NVO76555.1 enoyl-CoA hydratase/isomerase family protein [Undibacterium oligocarboniphilum]